MNLNSATPLRIFLLRAKVPGEKFCCSDPPSPCLTRGFLRGVSVVVSCPGPGSPDEVQVRPVLLPALPSELSRAGGLSSRQAGLLWHSNCFSAFSNPKPASCSSPSSLCSHDLSIFGEMPAGQAHLSFTARWAAVHRVAKSRTRLKGVSTQRSRQSKTHLHNRGRRVGFSFLHSQSLLKTSATPWL